MKKKMITLLKRFLPLVLAAFLLGISIYNINAKLLLGDPLPMPFGIGTSVVVSGSMEPELSVYDLIIVKETEELKDRQVVVYQSGKSLVVHRIVGFDGEDSIITRGDANDADDDPVKREAVKGEVVLAIPLVGALIAVLKHPIVTLGLLGVAIWLMERSFKKEKAKERSELEQLKEEIRSLSDQLKK